MFSFFLPFAIEYSSSFLISDFVGGYIKYFENGRKNMSFLIKDDEVWEKYEEIWDTIKNKLNIKFHSKSVYDKIIHKNQSNRI